LLVPVAQPTTEPESAWRQMLNSMAGPSLDNLRGRWQHSLVELGLLTVVHDIAFLDRGTSLRLVPTLGKDGGLITAGEWVVVPALSSPDRIIWAKAGPDFKIPDFLKEGAAKDLSMRLASLQSYDMCAWSRIASDTKFMLDRWSGGPQPFFEGPESVALFAVPPPAATPTGVRPQRILVYGDSLTFGWPAGDPYSRTMVDALGRDGVFTEVVGCGLGSVRASTMAGALTSKDIREGSGLRGEGLERLARTRGPFDLVIIMAGTVDVVKGESGTEALRLHEACHRLGLKTAALAVPPTWHDNPGAFTAFDLQKLQVMYNVSPETISSRRDVLNAKLREMATCPSSSSRAGCVLFVDTARLVPCCPENVRCWDKKDWLHLTPAGSKELGTGIAKRLLPLLRASAAGGGSLLAGGDAGPAAVCPARAPQAGTQSAPPAVPRNLVPRDPVLKSILRFARPDWTNQQILVVMDKLSQANVNSRAALLGALRGDGGRDLNDMLRSAGHKAFSAGTLQLLRDQFAVSGIGIKEEIVTYFKVVRDAVVVHRTPFTSSKVIGTRRRGEVLTTVAETYEGWLRLREEPGWVLRDMHGEDGLGAPLELLDGPVASAPELPNAPGHPPPAAGAGAGADTGG